MRFYAHTLRPEQALREISREKNSRGFVYLILDRFGSAFVVTQKLALAACWMNRFVKEPIDEPYACSSLYESALLRRGLHKNRWRVIRLDLDEHTPARIQQERDERKFDRAVLLGNAKNYLIS